MPSASVSGSSSPSIAAFFSHRKYDILTATRIAMMTSPNAKIQIGVSSCLLGEPVRWNGGHKRDRYVTDILGEFFEWVPVCPEVEVGMGTPRETVQLQGNLKAPKMVGTQTGQDWTAAMRKVSAQRVKELDRMDLCGFIFKAQSPSCGMSRIKIYKNAAPVAHNGSGLFAAAFMKQCPLVPVEEEGRLCDAKLRDNFIVRIFAFHRLKSLFKGSFSRKQVIAFHSAHKFLLMAHSRKHYEALGKMVAYARVYAPVQLRVLYAQTFMECLAMKSTVKKNTDVLYHMLGFFKKLLSDTEKRDLMQAIDDYYKGWLPLVVPVTLIRHQVNRHRVDYLADQVYLDPHPKELMLRNHV